MREILFRGKQVFFNDWIEGTGIFNDGINTWLSFNEPEKAIAYGLNHKRVYAETIGQFTGLTDKNGKKIFEGDILSVLVNEMAYPEEGSFEEGVFGRRKIPTGNKIRTVWSVEHKIRSNAGSTFFVYGKDRRFSRVLTGNTVYNAEAEVIGNIHDNPELL